MKQQHAAQIERLTRRIRELEQGLDEAYSSVSEEKHPLLKDESSGSGPPTPPAFKTSPPMMHHGPSVYSDDVIDHFGTPIVTALPLCASSESWGTSRYAENRSKGGFVLLWCDREGRSEYGSVFTRLAALRRWTLHLFYHLLTSLAPSFFLGLADIGAMPRIFDARD